MKDFQHVRIDGEKITPEYIEESVKQNNIKFIKLQFVDINGQLRYNIINIGRRRAAGPSGRGMQ